MIVYDMPLDSLALRSMTGPRLPLHWTLRPDAALGYGLMDRPAWS